MATHNDWGSREQAILAAVSGSEGVPCPSEPVGIAVYGPCSSSGIYCDSTKKAPEASIPDEALGYIAGTSLQIRGPEFTYGRTDVEKRCVAIGPGCPGQPPFWRFFSQPTSSWRLVNRHSSLWLMSAALPAQSSPDRAMCRKTFTGLDCEPDRATASRFMPRRIMFPLTRH